MKQKLRKILFIFVLMFGFVFSINAETKIKEDASKYDGDVYIIGSSKFDSNIIVTGTMAGKAGAREAHIQYFIYDNLDFNPDDLKIYYYSGLDKVWSLLPSTSDDEFRDLTEKEVKELTENLNIYYVNEEEKIIEIPYDPALKAGYELVLSTNDITDRSDELEYKDGKLIIPAAVRSVYLSAENSDGDSIYLDYIDQIDTEFKLTSVVVRTLEELKEAIASETPEIRLGSDITDITETITIPYQVELKGAGYKLTFKDVEKSGVVIAGDNSMVSDLTIEMNSKAGWQGNYALQVYDANGVSVYNFKGTKADAAILLNGANASFSEDIDVSGNEYGGIKVSKGEDPNLSMSMLVLNTKVEMTDEAISKPVIWVENGQGTVYSYAYGYLPNTNIPTAFGKTQTYYYSSNSIYETASVSTEDELKLALTLSDVQTIKLSNDISLNNELSVSREVTLNLNKKTLSPSGTMVDDELITVYNGGRLIISGNGVMNAANQNNDYSTAVWINGGELIINDGTFTNVGGRYFETNGITPNNNELIYASNGGKVTINGGTFTGNTENPTHGTRYTLNMKDNSSSQILVYGGTFVAYNPAASLSENPQANFVAEGYKVTKIDNEYTVAPLNDNDVAVADGLTYQNIQEAINSAKTGSIVKILKDVSLDNELRVEKELTIDLNGKTLSPSASMTDDELITVNATGKLTVEGNGTFSAATQNNDYSLAIWSNGGELIIKNGTFTNLGGKAFEDNGTTPNNNELIYASNGGKVTIYDGRFTGNYTNPTHKGRYTLNLKDNSNSEITVYGGTYVEFNPAASLSENPQANFVAEGYKIVETEVDGVREYTVVELEETDVAISEGTAYTTLNDAVTNANAKSTIKVLKDIALDTEAVVEKELTIDLNGKTLSPSASMTDDELITVNATGKLTVEGNGTFSAATQNNDYSLAIWANGGELIIKNGTFTNLGGKAFEDNGTTPNNNELIYASNGGKVTIYDGRFTGNYTNPTHKGRYTLNLKDNSNSEITVYGGTYVEFNPAASLSENPQANFVAEGYKIVETEVDGVREYTVVSE